MADGDYVLGTENAEVERLGIQHRVWRPYVLDAWRRAGINAGQTVIDIGCGPGYASTDLAEIVGPSGGVLAVERSKRFLDVLQARATRLSLTNIQPLERDVAESDFGTGVADAIWCRWLLCFLAQPRKALTSINAL